MANDVKHAGKCQLSVVLQMCKGQFSGWTVVYPWEVVIYRINPQNQCVMYKTPGCRRGHKCINRSRFLIVLSSCNVKLCIPLLRMTQGIAVGTRSNRRIVKVRIRLKLRGSISVKSFTAVLLPCISKKDW